MSNLLMQVFVQAHWVHEHKRKREDTTELGRKHFPQYSWTSERSVTDKLAHFAIKYVQMTVSGFLIIACGQTKDFKIVQHQ